MVLNKAEWKKIIHVAGPEVCRKCFVVVDDLLDEDVATTHQWW